jgi:ribosomal protein L40E
MEYMGWAPFIIGLVKYQKLASEAVPMDVYTCPKCQTVELRADRDSDVFENIKNHVPKHIKGDTGRIRSFTQKKCIKCGERIPLASEECPYCGAKQPEWKGPKKAPRSKGKDPVP